MNTVSPRVTLPAASTAFLKAVLLLTALAGTLDIVAAHLHVWAIYGSFPWTLCKGIAGGIFGREQASQGGVGMLLLGAGCHYLISFAFTLLFFLLRPRITLLRRSPWAVGIGYGAFVWMVMNFVVLRLSALSANPPNFANKHTYIGIAVLMAVFGIPIAWGAARLDRRATARIT